PPEQLKRFQKVYLNRGETTHVQFVLDARSFSYWDVTSHGWLVAPGAYQILVGSSSRDIRLGGQINADEDTDGGRPKDALVRKHHHPHCDAERRTREQEPRTS